MIVVIKGGLGNQLFQFAFGISVAARRHEKVYFYNACSDQWPYILAGHVPDVNFVSSFGGPIFRDPPDFRFDPTVYEVDTGSAVFDGYWQSEKYFDLLLVRRSLGFSSPLSHASEHLATDIESAGVASTFMHVRRGDYVTINPSLPLAKSYYHNAIEYVAARRGAQLFIFSDDPEWCRKEFPGERVIHSADPWEDLFLMSLCQNGIIANSTFSWWGAWLGERPDKIYVTPKRWFTPEHQYNDCDIVPDRWTRISE